MPERRRLPVLVITLEEQLRRWVAGDSTHRLALEVTGQYECVPDFSCCFPKLQIPVEHRLAYVQGNRATQLGALWLFLAGLCLHADPFGEQMIEVAGGGQVLADNRLQCLLKIGVRRQNAEGPLMVLADAIAQEFHRNYEQLAPNFGYETREESRTPWEQVPEQNKALMVATVRALLGRVITPSGELLSLLLERWPKSGNAS